MVGDLTQILCALNATDGFSNMTERWPVAFSFWAKPAELLKQTPNSNSRKLAPARSKNCRLEMLFAAAHQSVSVKVFGRRPHDDGAARTGAGVRKPPMEETAEGVARWRVRRYGDLAAVECEYNFCDMARTLRMGENTFRRPCNFKELRAVKRAHITTFALCAWWQPLYRIGRTNIST